MSLKSSTSVVRNAYLQCMNAAFQGNWFFFGGGGGGGGKSKDWLAWSWGDVLVNRHVYLRRGDVLVNRHVYLRPNNIKIQPFVLV